MEELIHAKASLNEYFNKLNQPNTEINPKGIKLSVPESVFEKKKIKLRRIGYFVPFFLSFFGLLFCYFLLVT